ncbi:1641_t:CDS:2 [Diversispora eburnea]|uniref:1641_t:CDS:1 n=1 Tax=Diversispora eburnea TaxID=1213867 RepID=A0A9N8YX81_9GLOM|nr:1641_t:CDS:2 [Diversispora eburnea]
MESYGGEPEIPHFEYFSYDKIQDLYEQRKGHFYFIPEGFEPVLVPNDSQAETVANLLENSRPVSTVPNVPRMLPDTDICLPSFALPCGVNGQKKDNSSKNGKNKKPPRPPNAFILYRRLKQPSIVASHQGITNNEVSKEIGKMWHEESMEERNKFQKMAEAAKEEHMRKYPEYRYRPRRPQERKRRGQATTKKQTAQQKQQQSQQLQTSLLSSQHPNPEIEEITTPQNASPSLQQMSYTHSPETFCAQSPEPDETITPPHSSPQQIPYTQSPENTLHNTFNINEVKPFVNDFTFNVDDMYYNSISQQFPDTPNYGFGYATYN